MAGLFYIMVAVGIVFVVWGYANEEKLISFEDKIRERFANFCKEHRKER